ncbi:cytochrome P450 [Streptomyces sp. NPDC002851]
MTVRVPGAVPAPGALPGLGHLWAVLRDPIAFAGSLPAHGDLVEIRLGPARAYVPCHPELLWQVLTDDRTFDKDGTLYTKVRAVAGNPLPLCTRQDHRRQRRLTQPAFRRSRIEDFSAVMADEFEAATSRWSEGQVLDAFPVLFDASLRTVCRTLLALSPGPDAVREFRQALATGLRGFLPGFLLPAPLERLPLPFIRHPQLMRALERARDILLHSGASGASQESSALFTALTTPRGNCPAMTERERGEQLVPMIIAGSDTVASLLSWTLYLLSHHPEAEHRLHAEADALPSVRWEHLGRLPHTTRVLTEALRLYPPAWLMPRSTTTTVRLGSAELPRATTVLFCGAAVHRHPDVYPHPHTFDPDRWLPHRAQSLPRGAFVPFGAGPRTCIGDHYGMAEATLALATIARRWTLRIHPRSDPRPTALGTVLTPRRLLLRLHRR